MTTLCLHGFRVRSLVSCSDQVSIEPLDDRSGHSSEVLTTRELMVCSRQQIQACGATKRIKEPRTLVERNKFVLFPLHNEGWYGDSLGRSVGNLTKRVLIEAVSESNSGWATQDVWNGVSGLPVGHFLRAEF